MAKRYLVVSDLHLSDLEEHDDGWKAYKSARFLFDDELAALVARFTGEAGPGDELLLVLNGDVFDFDLVTAAPRDGDWPVDPSELKRGLDPSRGKSAWKLRRILDDHPIFVRMLAGFLADGHRLVYVLGNHDRELHFETVRQVLLDALQQSAAGLGRSFDPGQVCFEPWFYLEAGVIYVEHGQQYDHYSSFRNVLAPEVVVRRERLIALPMGNLSNRYLITSMGYFNPFSGDFILNIYSYVVHWLRHYAFTPRSLVFSWLLGSLLVMAKLLQMRKLFQRAPDAGPLLDAVAAAKGLPRSTVDALYKLQRPPITGRFYRIVREFWLDRLLLALLLVGGTVTLVLLPVPLWLELTFPLLGCPLLFFVYEWLARGETIFAIEKTLPRVARDIAALVPVKVVTFGHTHVPRLIPLEKGVSYVDTGTWAPIMQPDSPTELKPGYRNYLIATFTAGEARVELGSWLGPGPGSESAEAGRAAGRSRRLTPPARNPDGEPRPPQQQSEPTSEAGAA